MSDYALRRTRTSSRARATSTPSRRSSRSHRNERDEPVEIWAISRRQGHGDATKIDEFREASPDASQERAP